MMKMTLEGIQVAAEIGLKAGGTAAKSLAVTLYAIITDNKKIKGKTNLDNLLKSGKEMFEKMDQDLSDLIPDKKKTVAN